MYCTSRIGSPKCYSPRATSPRLRSPSPRARLFNWRMSPYQRITSPKSIGNIALPSFLRLSCPGTDELLKNFSLTRVRTNNSTADTSIFNKCNQQSPISEIIAGKGSNSSEFVNYVFDSKLYPEQVLLRVGKIELTRKDLTCLRPGKLLPINLIDACLSCIKKRNKKMFQKSETHQRVIIMKTSFSQKVFQSKEKNAIRSKKNLLNFEYLLFPLFIGYWTILVINNREKTAKYYDPIGIEKNEKQVFKGLFDFLKQEISFHQGKSIESTRWKHLECQRVNEIDAYDHIDSAVYVLRLAFKISTGKDIEISPDVLNEYRTKLIALLFKYGTKIVY
ncbi:hypothetical protein SteCoe_34350 [Stentor coeruleus]|uniref:Ubiquitin-like protease family profile domain-containing protein n=1 Tax=Stentor coeruleus TaxID=5963 RepID=A0A1R2AV21_9CILI|nr:hypothetical protein SteCoe_34350 [Stentor coeruleus]